MNDETLKQLLQRADASQVETTPTTSAGSLLAAARRRRKRNVGVRVVATTVVLAAAAVGAQRKFDRNARSEADGSLARPVRSANVDDLRRRLAQLEQEAGVSLQVVRGLAEQPTEVGGPISDADLLRLEAARSAAISWQYATLVETDLGDRAAARREYQRVAERFPGTEWADMAAVSLLRLSKLKDSPSL
jgi:hypothetical protein